MHIILASQTAEEVSTFNVVGDLKGSEHPEQVVIVSGHLDSWDLGTGAIDDAAGVAVALEAAELMQQLHLRPKRTLRVIAWIDEENLGRGHLEYAKVHAAEIGQHVAAIESDLGASHPLGFRAKISPEAAARLQPVLEVLRPSGANLLLLSSIAHAFAGTSIKPFLPDPEGRVPLPHERDVPADIGAGASLSSADHLIE